MCGADKAGGAGFAGADGVEISGGPLEAGVVVIAIEDETVDGVAGVFYEHGVAAGDHLFGGAVDLRSDILGEDFGEARARWGWGSLG